MAPTPLDTKHYKIQNLEKIAELVGCKDRLEKYIGDIEKVFPTIEEIFGKKWNDDYIYIELTDSTDSGGYGRPGGRHVVSIGINDKIIQEKEYPENLWGCLLHETLHAFMNPIIHGSPERPKQGGPNKLDGCFDNEPFARAFQGLVYLSLKKKGEITTDLCNEFLTRLENELNQEARIRLYKRYITFFTRNDSFLSRFIRNLDLSSNSIIRDNFWEDLEKLEKKVENI